jgi:predicted dehydrogenase
MEKISRRKFVKLQAAAGVASLFPGSRILGANDRIGVGVIGVRGRGRSHIAMFQAQQNVEVRGLCDVDKQMLDRELNKLRDQGAEVTGYRNFHHLLDNPAIDVVAIATPDHWHVPMAASAILSGKDVYVEKPLSHTIAEGRYLVDIARKHRRMVQHGTQSRSMPNIRNAIDYLRSGKLGTIRMAKAINCQLREPIGRQPDSAVPAHVDYDMWLGPAPERPFNLNRFHYNWHWFWDYGTGDTGNDGAHQLDIARWGLDVAAPNAVSCSGGQLFYRDAHETPDTQIATFEFDHAYIMFEMRLWTPYPQEGHDNGNIFYADDGLMSIGRKGWQVTFKDGSLGPGEPRGQEDHAGNFIAAVRSRNRTTLTADVESGHQTSVLCHLANISMRVGRKLLYDSKAEQFIEDTEANGLLRKTYREGFELPV